ncbi:hypothetical protein Tco_1200780 [Tanacetum coccineum]
MFRPTSSHFQNSSRPVYYNEMYMGGGRWELLLRPQQVVLGKIEDQICNGDPKQWWISSIYMENPLKNKDLGIIDSGCSRSMSGNKERLDDFVSIKGGTVTFGGREGRITGKGTIKTSMLDFEIHTDENVADLLTKTFDGPRFNYLVVHIGMLNP